MTQVNASTDINAPKEKVWAILADFGNIAAFAPNLRSSHSTSAENSGVGATRHCDLAPMGAVEERVLEWTEGSEMSEMLVAIYSGERMPPLDFDHTTAHLSVEALSANRSRVTMTFSYRVKGGPLGALMNQFTIKSQFRKVIPNVLKGLKHYAEHGERAKRADLKNLDVRLRPA